MKNVWKTYVIRQMLAYLEAGVNAPDWNTEMKHLNFQKWFHNLTMVMKQLTTFFHRGNLY